MSEKERIKSIFLDWGNKKTLIIVEVVRNGAVGERTEYVKLGEIMSVAYTRKDKSKKPQFGTGVGNLEELIVVNNVKNMFFEEQESGKKSKTNATKSALRYVNPEKNTKEIVIADNRNDNGLVINGKYYNKLEILEDVRKDDKALRHAPKEILNNFDIVLEAVTHHGLALMYVSDELQNNIQVVLAAVRESEFALKHASKELKNNYNIVLTAVKNDGYALAFASEELKNNYNIVLTAVKNDVNSLRYASKSLQNNKKILYEVRNFNFGKNCVFEPTLELYIKNKKNGCLSNYLLSYISHEINYIHVVSPDILFDYDNKK